MKRPADAQLVSDFKSLFKKRTERGIDLKTDDKNFDIVMNYKYNAWVVLD